MFRCGIFAETANDRPQVGRTRLPFWEKGTVKALQVYAVRVSITPWSEIEASIVGTAFEAAYTRSDLLERRQRLMKGWATYLARPSTGR